MSKAGQNTFTGIGLQADIALLKLLESYRYENFSKITLEETGWEDFCLYFSDRIDSYEVKWHKSLSYSGVKEIIEKELNKKPGTKEYKFKIACKQLSPEFKKDYQYIKKNLYYWNLFNKAPIETNPVIKRFLKKGWKENHLLFLLKIDIEEFYSDTLVANKIYEHFRLQEHVFLESVDLNSLVATAFRKVMQLSRIGSAIEKKEFVKSLEAFQKSLAEKSESFTPDLFISKKQENLNPYLSSEKEFAKLNNARYLTPLSTNRRLIMFLVDELTKNNFSLQSMGFFLEKVLLKNAFQHSCLRIFEAKNKSGNLDFEYFIYFVDKYFGQISDAFLKREIYKILLSVAEKSQDSKVSDRILKFLRNHVLQPFKEKESDTDDTHEYRDEFLPALFKEVGKTLGKKDTFLDLLFEHFDFTAVSYGNPGKTSAAYYAWIKEYIEEDVFDRMPKVVKKIHRQYKQRFGKVYKGYELVGGGVGWGVGYSINDTSIVTQIFTPLFHSIYASSKDKFWKTVKNFAFSRPENLIACPIFLRRAAGSVFVSILRDENAPAKESSKAKRYLKQVLEVKKGIPGTSEIIFDDLRNFQKVDEDFFIDLIKFDSHKYGQNNIPTNIFVVETTLNLVVRGNKDAQSILYSWIKDPVFVASRTYPDMLSILASTGFVEKVAPRFLAELMPILDIPAYLSKPKSSGIDNVYFIAAVINRLLGEEDVALQGILTPFFLGDHASERAQGYIGSALSHVKEEKIVSCYDLIQKIFGGKFTIENTTNLSSELKTGLIRLAEVLGKQKQYERARAICDLFINDPNPETSNNEEDFNYHLKIKTGASEIVITTIRGHTCWLLQRFAVSNEPELMEYALAKTKTLLDLDASFARSLGYPETNYYIVSQATVPLIELAHPARRKMLNDFKAGLGDEVRALSLQLLDWCLEAQTKGAKPMDIAKHIIHIFSYIRDLDTTTANKLLDLFESLEVHDSAFLFIYFAFLREHDYKSVEFDKSQFKQRLMRLCKTRNPMRRGIAWNFWKIFSQKEKDPNLKDAEMRPYWEAFLEQYGTGSFDYLTMIFETRFAAKTSYVLDKALLFKAVKLEIDALKEGKSTYPRITFYKLGKILAEISVEDFLKLVELVLQESDFSSGTNVYGMNIPEFKKIFDGLVKANLSSSEAKLYDSVDSLMKKLAVS